MYVYCAKDQGDQIGRIFAFLAIILFGQFFITEVPLNWEQKKLFINFDKMWIGLHFVRFFSQTRLVALLRIKPKLGRVTAFFPELGPNDFPTTKSPSSLCN
jgi:hypothetical protein